MYATSAGGRKGHAGWNLDAYPATSLEIPKKEEKTIQGDEVFVTLSKRVNTAEEEQVFGFKPFRL